MPEKAGPKEVRLNSRNTWIVAAPSLLELSQAALPDQHRSAVMGMDLDHSKTTLQKHFATWVKKGQFAVVGARSETVEERYIGCSLSPDRFSLEEQQYVYNRFGIIINAHGVHDLPTTPANTEDQVFLELSTMDPNRSWRPLHAAMGYLKGQIDNLEHIIIQRAPGKNIARAQAFKETLLSYLDRIRGVPNERIEVMLTKCWFNDQVPGGRLMKAYPSMGFVIVRTAGNLYYVQGRIRFSDDEFYDYDIDMNHLIQQGLLDPTTNKYKTDFSELARAIEQAHLKRFGTARQDDYR